MKKLKILGLNTDTFWKDKQKNFSNIEKELSKQSADVFLLTEMFSTGFCMNAEEIADRNNETLNWMLSFAKEKNAAVVGSTSVMEDGKFFNRMYFVEPSGKFHQYDKRHLFSLTGEDKVYTKGNKRIVVEYLGVKFLLQICYDLRFPVFSRNTDDYDVALYSANWPDKRIDAWQSLLKARAIENQCYVFGLNRIGTDGNQLYYPESSYCFSAEGKDISTKNGNVVSANLDLEELKNFREKFPFLKDRD